VSGESNVPLGTCAVMVPGAEPATGTCTDEDHAGSEAGAEIEADAGASTVPAGWLKDCVAG
jgi:hypothetical protein